MSINIAGIDLSLSNTGIVISKNGEYTSYTVKAGKNDCKEERLEKLVTEILNILRINEVKAVAVEGYSFGSVFNSLIMVELGSLFRYALYKKGIPFVNIPPTSLKKFVTGKGNCKKERILLEVYRKWNAEFKTNDEADAFGLVKVLEGMYCSDSLLKYENEVIKKEIKAICKNYLTKLKELGFNV